MNRQEAIKRIFNDKMSSTEAESIFFDYVAKHKGENVDAIKDEYRKVSKKIIRRERKENAGVMTSHHHKESNKE